MNTNEAAQILFTYFSPEERSIPDNATYPGRNAAVRKAMNDALQDLLSKGKPWCRSEERGTLINAPVNLSVKVTQGSPVAEIPESEWRSWFRGCTLAIEGVSHDNQVKSDGEIVGDFPEGSVMVGGNITPAIGMLIPAGELNGKPMLSSDGEQTPSGPGWAKAVFDDIKGEGDEWAILSWSGTQWKGWVAPGHSAAADILSIPADAWVVFTETSELGMKVIAINAVIDGLEVPELLIPFGDWNDLPSWTSDGLAFAPGERIVLFGGGVEPGINWAFRKQDFGDLTPFGFQGTSSANTPDVVAGWEIFGEGSFPTGEIVSVEQNYIPATGAPTVTRLVSTRQFVLKLPYAGESGTHTARLFHDCITLGADVLEVHEPVNVGGCEIRPFNNSSPQGRPRRDDYGFRDIGPACCPPGRVSATAGTPRNFHVEAYLAGPNAVPTYRLRLMPAPSAASLIEYDAMLVPPKVSDLASTAPLPIPFDFAESVFLPIAVKKLRSSPFWRGVVGEDQVQGDYLNALGILNESQPQRRSGISFRLPY